VTFAASLVFTYLFTCRTVLGSRSLYSKVYLKRRKKSMQAAYAAGHACQAG